VIAKLKGMSPDDVAKGGGMSRYGRSKVSEDIAEMVAHAKTGPLFRAKGLEEESEDWGCRALRELDSSSLPANLSAVYTKLVFVRDLGLIDRDEFETCVGEGLSDRDRDLGPGFHVYQDGDYQRSFEMGVDAFMGPDSNDGGDFKFVLEAEGQASWDDMDTRAEVTLKIETGEAGRETEDYSWPRGVYTLAPGHGHDFRLYLPDAQAGSFESIDGFVLVTESSEESIRGSIFLRRAMRWLAPVPVPQTFDPPLGIQFNIENM
jgi:hypothetical protein